MRLGEDLVEVMPVQRRVLLRGADQGTVGVDELDGVRRTLMMRSRSSVEGLLAELPSACRV